MMLDIVYDINEEEKETSDDCITSAMDSCQYQYCF
jgi:hypothetical protein